MLAFIGSRTTRERNARGEGITVCRVGDDGLLSPVQVVGGLENPSYLALNRRGDRLYTVHGDGDACSVLAIDPITSELRLLHTRHCGVRNPVHLALAPQEQHLVVSSHLTGELVVVQVHEDGRLGAVEQRVALPGEPGPHRVEQPFSKPHFNSFDPTGRFVVVPDKGLDRIFVFRLEGGRLSPAAVPFVPTREGAGPRTVAFHPTGRHLFAVNELDSTVMAYRFDATSGALTPRQWLPLLADTYTGNSRAAGIAISDDGRHLYASNRGCDTIEVFAIDPDRGRLTHRGSRTTEGRTPRFFALHPDGRALYALNEDSDAIVVVERNAVDGSLGRTLGSVHFGSPVCLVFGH
jgi:6-phosphogluconolactonase (cycloisomerase 2 family)